MKQFRFSSLLRKYLSEWVKKLNYNVLSVVLSFKKFNTENGIIILSEARGGSTWLMEILGNIPNTIFNWEPLHPEKGVVPKKFRWGNRPYLPENDSNPEYKKLMHEILCMKKHSGWTLERNSFSRAIKSETVITKFVRANLLLPWMLQNFRLNSKPIFLLRHPIDTCISHINAFGEMEQIKNKRDIPGWINNERFFQHFDLLKKPISQLEYRIAFWCLNNAWVIQKNFLNKCIIVYYEDLVMHPEEERKRILIELKRNEMSEKAMYSVNLRKASSTNFKNELKTNPEEQLIKNIKNLNSSTKEKIQKIFDHFNFTVYNAFSPFPDKRIN